MGRIVPTDCLDQKTQVATVLTLKGVGSKVRDRQSPVDLGIPLIPGLASVLVR